MAPQSTPKGMSSRLATMKFMQRGSAQAKAGVSSPSTPTAESEVASSSKRRKFSHADSPSVATPDTPLFDQEAIQRAIDEEEQKRQAAINKRAAELGDEHWELDLSMFPAPNSTQNQMKVVPVGFAQIDNASSGSEDDMSKGDQISLARRRFNMKAQACVVTKNDDSGSEDDSGSSDSELSDEEESHQPKDGSNRGRRAENATPRSGRARTSLSGRQSEERKKANEFAEKRRKKEVNLSKLTSLSASQDNWKSPLSAKITCHGCGKIGHRVADCPSKKRR
ncbi:hypothetical protein OQA88_7540 [Cercophora sp. LCS_1]